MEPGRADPDRPVPRPAFGAIYLEDIAQPKCFRALDALRRTMAIPVWHDDQQGSATALLAGLIRFVETTSAPRYLLLTECAMADNIAAARPDKPLLRLVSVRCPHMNQITLENTLDALRRTVT